ncbi:hypothetical protein BT93_L2479 [Corymbia citriodora subsp. variegata]|uniref:Uncharacterized protein n=1 Tax=Corymbia citriodora subsp. variegata TaxID=360336 RepID=A0A8T0CJD5_CORYI|nr:hypothetical protein BT93_L2479 [Corymbia citriodora subsp. variegata]
MNQAPLIISDLADLHLFGSIKNQIKLIWDAHVSAKPGCSSSSAEMEVQMIEGANTNHMNAHADDPFVPGVASDWSTVVNSWLNQRPTRLKQSAGNSACCIFRVPETLIEINQKANKPRIVSIGPYHHEREGVQMIQEHKPRFFSALLARTRVNFCDYFDAIASKEEDIRACYSEPLVFGASKLSEMMVLDGCFIIEVLRAVEGIIPRDPDDPIFKMPWPLTSLMRDFLHLENQVPFFVLQKLYDMSKSPDESQLSLTELVLQFFKYTVQRRPEVFTKYRGVSDVKHLLHLIQLSLINLPPEVPREFDDKYLRPVQSVTELRSAGIKFKPRKCNEWLDIQFNNGVLEIPPLMINDLTSSFFLNSITFEQCYSYCSPHITSYLAFIRCLVTTVDDASFLSVHHVLENKYGTDAEVASFFNDLGKDVGFNMERSYLAGVIEELNRYYESRWRGRWTMFKYKYFGNPGSLISALAGFVTLMLTAIQSFFAVYAYIYPPKQ